MLQSAADLKSINRETAVLFDPDRKLKSLEQIERDTGVNQRAAAMQLLLNSLGSGRDIDIKDGYRSVGKG